MGGTLCGVMTRREVGDRVERLNTSRPAGRIEPLPAVFHRDAAPLIRVGSRRDGVQSMPCRKIRGLLSCLLRTTGMTTHGSI